MLELKNITKVYLTGAIKQKVLNSVSLVFGEQEFTSILGPSGSGKTTLLNIIGGLDHYTSGDLIIDGISTKKYKDADWDAYRNHRIGFVFQSYNLISHQTILNNVRLALMLSGISKREGNRRAKKALKEVGLSDHIHKRPAQLSGGQMQRVAIARALVNDPDILLADEPTGALDSETSVQIMELLKEISKTKLVIMVTHNPELAEKYSTRIINLKDGVIENDSNNFEKKTKKRVSKETKEKAKHKSKKTKMSFLTALGLSLNNLLTKKGRTILVAFAGSIGIIGIALILAVSTGFQNYVDSIQEDTLASYPLMISEEAFSLDALLGEDAFQQGFTDEEKENYAKRAESADVVEFPALEKSLSTVAKNDLKSFKKHYESRAKDLEKDVKAVYYKYAVEPTIFAVDATDKIVKLNPSDLFSSMFGGGSSIMSSFTAGSTTSVYNELRSDEETRNAQYDILAGRWPEEYDEMIINLGQGDGISDFLAFQLGLKDTSKLSSLVQKLMAGEKVEIPSLDDMLTLSYEDLLGLDLRLVLPSDLYKYNEKYDVYEDMSGDADFIKDLYENKSVKLKIVGIVSAKDGVMTEALEQGVNYSPELIDYIIDHSKDSEIVKKQLENPEKNIFSGNKFEEKSSFDYTFEDLVSVDEAALADMFNVTIDEKALAAEIEKYMTEISNAISVDTTPAKTAFSDAFDQLTTLLEIKVKTYNEEHPDSPLQVEDSAQFVKDFLSEYDPGSVLAKLEEGHIIPADVYRETFSGVFQSLLEAYIPMSTYGVSLKDFADNLKQTEIYQGIEAQLANAMTEAKIKKEVLEKVGSLTTVLSNTFAQSFNIDPSKFSSAFSLNFSEDELMRVMESMLNRTDATLKGNLSILGYQDLEDPSGIWFYFSSFDGKENFIKFINEYNSSANEDKKIEYSDITGILMSSVKTIVNAVSYVLIAFVSISLVVSSIMIGVITYISVYERTKEIGILRAIGASKHNISNIFNAETFIIGFLSGIIGVGISYTFIPIINGILNHLTNVTNLQAILDPSSALILILLSIGLTLLGGLIPARAASRKDPVEALRTE